MPTSTGKRPRERGVVIIWIAVFMLLMLAFVALGIDVSKLAATKTQLQNAADAAALAGASAINMETGVLVQDTAIVRAQFTASQNRAFADGPQAVSLLAGDITFPAADEIKVVARRNPAAGGSMVTHVAQVLGITRIEVSATATARAAPATSDCEGLVPMGAIPPGGEVGFQVGCANRYTLFHGQGGGVNGNWQALSFPRCDEAGPCSGMSPTGANTLRCLVANGYSCCIEVGQVLQTEPGQQLGPMRQALQQRFDSDAVRTQNICYQEYLLLGGTKQRVVHVPIIEPLGAGRTDTRVTGFAAFFLRTRPGGGGPALPVEAEFLYDVAPGGTGSGSGTSTGTIFALRLVR